MHLVKRNKKNDSHKTKQDIEMRNPKRMDPLTITYIPVKN